MHAHWFGPKQSRLKTVPVASKFPPTSLACTPAWANWTPQPCLLQGTAQLFQLDKREKQKTLRGDFLSGGPVVKNPPSNAENVSSIPRQGTKIPYVMGQQTLVAQLLSPWASSRAWVPQLERSQRSTMKSSWVARKILCATTKIQCSQNVFAK